MAHNSKFLSFKEDMKKIINMAKYNRKMYMDNYEESVGPIVKPQHFEMKRFISEKIKMFDSIDYIKKVISIDDHSWIVEASTILLNNFVIFLAVYMKIDMIKRREDNKQEQAFSAIANIIEFVDRFVFIEDEEGSEIDMTNDDEYGQFLVQCDNFQRLVDRIFKDIEDHIAFKKNNIRVIPSRCTLPNFQGNTTILDQLRCSMPTFSEMVKNQDRKPIYSLERSARQTSSSTYHNSAQLFYKPQSLNVTTYDSDNILSQNGSERRSQNVRAEEHVQHANSINNVDNFGMDTTTENETDNFDSNVDIQWETMDSNFVNELMIDSRFVAQRNAILFRSFNVRNGGINPLTERSKDRTNSFKLEMEHNSNLNGCVEIFDGDIDQIDVFMNMFKNDGSDLKRSCFPSQITENQNNLLIKDQDYVYKALFQNKYVRYQAALIVNQRDLVKKRIRNKLSETTLCKEESLIETIEKELSGNSKKILQRKNVDSLLKLEDDVSDKNQPKSIISGCFDAILCYATLDQKKNLNFIDVFLTTYREDVDIMDLLYRLIYRLSVFYSIDNMEAQNITAGVIYIMIRAVHEARECELSSILALCCIKFTNLLLHNGMVYQATIFRSAFVKILSLHKEPPIMENSAIKFSQFRLTKITDIKSNSIAETLTCIEKNYIDNIDIYEMMSYSSSFKKRKISNKLSNLQAYTTNFNKFSYWCRTQIVTATRQKDRDKIYNKLVKVMKICKSLNNFSSMFAIIYALNSVSVTSFDWPKNSHETLRTFTNLASTSESFKIYRKLVCEAKEAPFIPFIAVFLHELEFINQSEKRFCNPSIDVNFLRHWKQYNALSDLIIAQKRHYVNLKPNPRFIGCLNNYANILNDSELWEMAN